jgi:hypothetical protein
VDGRVRSSVQSEMWRCEPWMLLAGKVTFKRRPRRYMLASID